MALVVVAAVTAGCSDSPFDLADVSGVVTLDGEPLTDASVRFMPQASGASPVVGPSSVGITDSEGRYNLRTHDRHDGAVVGPHVVSISTYSAQLVDPENSDRVEVLSKERVPARYRTRSELRIEVASGGTDEANFELTSR